MKNILKLLSYIIISITIWIGLQYLFVIPQTIYSFAFWISLSIIVIVIGTIIILSYRNINEKNHLKDVGKILLIIGISLVIIPTVISVINSPIFRANSYKALINIEEGDFANDIPEAMSTYIMDIETAVNIGSRVIGEIDNVSQYVISDEYNMIEYNGITYRISPLEYASFFKAFGNKGISGYVLIDCKTQEAKLIKLSEKMMYSPSSIFTHDLYRHIWSNGYYNCLLGKEQFEIDEAGVPYYIVPTYKPQIGLFGGKTLENILVVNAINGKIDIYSIDNLPEWIDHADSVNHMMELATYNYKYVNGFLNTLFSQKDVKALSFNYNNTGEEDIDIIESYIGYSSIKTNNGINYFTGVTSVNNDESILGFLFLNPRTGKVVFYDCVGAEELSAKSSAEALVQNYGYISSYPFIVNVDGIETYLVALKDKTGTNKAYSFVNVKNYTIATQASTKEEALKLYKEAMANNGVIENSNSSITGTIIDIYNAVENSTTFFYYKIDGYNELFVSSILINREQLLYKQGDEIEVFASLENGYYLVSEIKKK